MGLASASVLRSTLGDDLYSCAECAKSPDLYVSLGHDGPPSDGMPWAKNALTGEPLIRCPVRTLQLAPAALREEFVRMRDVYYPLYKGNNLLVDGGVSDQPSRYLEWMQLFAEADELVLDKIREMNTPKTKGD